MRGSRARTLRRLPLRRTPPSEMWLALMPRSVLVPAIVPGQKTKAAAKKKMIVGCPFLSSCLAVGVLIDEGLQYRRDPLLFQSAWALEPPSRTTSRGIRGSCDIMG